MQIGRKEFIHKTAIALAAATVAPTSLLSTTTERPPINDLGIVDLHCHPSLKMYLWNKKLWKKYHPSAGANPFPLQYTVDQLNTGYVKGLLVAHYLVEAAL